MDQKNLIHELIQCTGLPEDLALKEFESLAQKANKHIENLSLEDVRHIFSMYLQEVLLSAKKEHSETTL